MASVIFTSHTLTRTNMKPVIIIVGKAGTKQSDYDNLMWKAQPYNLNKFWTDHLPKGMPLLVTQWNLGVFADGEKHMPENVAALTKLIVDKFGTQPVKVVGHSYGGGTAIRLPLSVGSEIYLVDAVNPELYGAKTPTFVAPMGLAKCMSWVRIPSNQVPFSAGLTGIAAGSPLAITNTIYPYLPNESTDNAHGRKMWDTEVIKTVAA
jgi:hypothetical protein